MTDEDSSGFSVNVGSLLIHCFILMSSRSCFFSCPRTEICILCSVKLLCDDVTYIQEIKVKRSGCGLFTQPSSLCLCKAQGFRLTRFQRASFLTELLNSSVMKIVCVIKEECVCVFIQEHTET